MKKIPMTMVLLFNFFLSYSQNGLEKIIVEKYYITDANDASANGTDGILPVGSTTYRVYLDLLPGYIFQSAYGDPFHELRIATTTGFFNNETRGSTSPTYKLTQAKTNTVMLDSWLSAGGACTGQIGVLKTEDDGVANIVNSNGLLQNNDPKAGIPLTQQDGMKAGNPSPVTTVGINNEIAIFDNENLDNNGVVFKTNNGAWASLEGGRGADSITNKVLIGQFTTNGTFSFELNVQIRSANFVVEQYVARDPVGTEFTEKTLIFNSDSIISSISTDQNQDGVKIYPNPANDYLFVEMSSNSTSNHYAISDLSGNTITSGELSGYVSTSKNSKIDISQLKSGMYILTIKQTDKKGYYKIIKR